MAFFNPETIRAMTPIFLAASGAIIGIFVVLNDNIDAQKATAAFGLAGTAIAGASGLAQPNKSESDSTGNRDKQDASEQSLNEATGQ